jgi:hypothetical protein
MKASNNWLLGTMLLALLSGCVSDVANRYYAKDRYPAVPVDHVQVLNAPPDRPYELIADFQSRGDTVGSMREKAAEVGADAVIVVKLGGDSPKGQEWAADQTIYHSNEDRIVGSAIRYK